MKGSWARSEVQWRYLIRGPRKHALLDDALGTSDQSEQRVAALCGVAPTRRYPHWLGTGTQSEREHLTRLTECLRCVKYLRPTS